MNPNNSDFYNSYGITLEEQDKNDEAVIAYKKSIELNP